MVIGFCGRMRAGKSTLAEVCEKHGFHRLSFATPLKGLCADLLELSIDELNDAKNKGIDISLPLDDKIQEKLSIETEIPGDKIKQVCDGQVMSTVRELLQFVGTELIRKYCPTWHIDRTKKMMKPRHNYVIDDVRFQNEKEMIELIGGHCWFVSRPTLSNLSSHPSETSIRWQDCGNKIIVNNDIESILKLVWGFFMEDYDRNVALRECTIREIVEEGTLSNGKGELADLLFISNYMLTYQPPRIDGEITDYEFSSDGVLKIRTNGETNTSFITQNPLEIEDIKFLLQK